MKMSKETREHLSALVDGEISRDTSRFLVKRLGVDEQLRDTWTRYHLVRDCLRHQDGSIAGEDLCARVSSALVDDAPAKAPRAVSAKWLKPFAGLAIAASVALMAIVTVGPGIPGETITGGDLADQAQPATFVSPQAVSSLSNRRGLTNAVSRSGGSKAGNEKMNSYLLRHYQATGATGGKGFVTFVPIVITGSKAMPESESSEVDLDSEATRDEDSASQ
jgi:sigma-E factor negative regulatory protein RseA